MPQQLLAIPMPAMVGMGDDIFDEAIGAATAGEVGNQGDGAGVDEFVTNKAAEVTEGGVLLNGLPCAGNNFLIRERVIFLV